MPDPIERGCAVFFAGMAVADACISVYYAFHRPIGMALFVPLTAVMAWISRTTWKES